MSTVCRIPLTNGGFATVDASDMIWLSKYEWRRSTEGYAVRTYNRTTILMHRMITKAMPEQLVDHKDRSKLNNVRNNLRIATRQQNSANTNKISTRSSSQYKGVYYHRDRAKWVAGIGINDKQHYLGSFTNEVDAALAYDAAARKAFGEFAYTNFIEVMEEIVSNG